jgi:hypothetical protein
MMLAGLAKSCQGIYLSIGLGINRADYQCPGATMPKIRGYDDHAATELHNKLSEEIVLKILQEPIVAGGSVSDVMLLCESVIVGVFLKTFHVGSDVKALDLVIGRVKERLAKARLEDVGPKGRA